MNINQAQSRRRDMYTIPSVDQQGPSPALNYKGAAHDQERTCALQSMYINSMLLNARHIYMRTDVAVAQGPMTAMT